MLNRFKKRYFAKAFLHTAGQSLQAELNKRFLYMGVVIGFMLMAALWIFVGLFLFRHVSLYPILLALFCLGCLYPLERGVDTYWQGMTGEKLVRDEIEPLIRHGYHIFNDVLGDKFNIDFLVIGPSGIYVIEVKNPTKGKGEDRIKYENGQIYLNNHIFEKKNPVKQAEMSANWLSEKFRQVEGHKLSTIKPVVLFPNFLVDEYAESVWVMNPKRFVSHYVANAAKVLSQEEIDKIVGMLRMYVYESSPLKNS